MKLSIIIPVYNLGDLISRCLESIVSQNFSDYEVIIIDDGSEDHSVDICKEYVKMYSNIVLLSQSNRGVSVARNRGIKEAKGDWICFIDGDDFVECESFSYILENKNINDYDCIISRSYTNNGEKQIKERYKFPSKYIDKTFTGLELGVKEGYFRGSIWGAFFRRKILIQNNIWFPPNIRNGEDTFVFSLVLIYFKNIAFSDVSFYNVYEREGSASRSWSFSRIVDMVDCVTYINTYLSNNKNLVPEAINILHYNLYRTVSAIYTAFSKCHFSFKHFTILNTRIKSEISFKINIGAVNVSDSKIKLFNRSILLFALSIFIKNKCLSLINKNS